MPDKRSNILYRDSMMGRLIRKKDWSKTPLGPLENWSAALMSIVNLILDTNFPIVICWGKHLITIYNDAYSPLLGNKPEALGLPFLEVWPEAIDIIEPQINRALNGEPGYFKNAEFTLIRYGKPEKAWFDYSYSPLRDAEDKIQGIINVCIEVTEKIKTQFKLKKINDTLEKKVRQRTATLEEYKDQLRILTYELNKAEEQERHRLARLLHDHLGQLLDLSVIKLDQLKTETFQENFPGKIEELKEIILMSNKYTRELVNELKPPPIFEKGNIVELLGWLAQWMKKYGLEITMEDDGKPKPVGLEVHKILYQSVRELFFNIVKHAAVDKAKLTINRHDNRIRIIVEDSGTGFDLNGKTLTPTNIGGFGLFNVKERMDLFGGILEIDSEPGKGTRAILNAPLDIARNSVPLISDGSLQRYIDRSAKKEYTSWLVDFEQPNIYDPNQMSLPLKMD